jgi:hypothetical protein
LSGGKNGRFGIEIRNMKEGLASRKSEGFQVNPKPIAIGIEIIKEDLTSRKKKTCQVIPIPIASGIGN